MSTRQNSVFICLILLLTSCAFISQNLNDAQVGGIKIGMTKDAVISKLGKPAIEKDIVIDGKEHEVWKYPIEERLKKNIKPLGQTYYQLFFSEDKVVKWDKVKTYAQPNYDFQEPSPGDSKVTTIEIFKAE